MMNVFQPTTGKKFELVETKAALWSDQMPTEIVGDVLISEGVGTIDGSVFCFWIGSKAIGDSGVMEAINAHLADHDVVGLRYIRALPSQVHPLLHADLARIMRQSKSMRGLECRFDYIKAKLAHAIDPSEDTSSDLAMICLDAEIDGMNDFRQGCRNVPPMFLGENDLVSAWEDGYCFASEIQEMSECSGCNDGTGNPCFTHG